MPDGSVFPVKPYLHRGLTRCVSLDYETFGQVQLTGQKSVGVWNYASSPLTEALMAGFRFDRRGDYHHVDLARHSFPDELRDRLLDPECEKWGFNAGFERLITKQCLGIDTPYRGWRCTMALANLQSFTGDLRLVGTSMGLGEGYLKDTEGSRLISLFCEPQRLTRANRFERRDRHTDPADWERFCRYNIQDVVAEERIGEILRRYEIPDREWQLYELDQEINDRGLPVNLKFVEQADRMANMRRKQLKEYMTEATGLVNPGSVKQLLPWLRERGYGFEDLQKASVQKEITRNETEGHLTEEAVNVMRWRAQESRTSVRKYPAIMRRASADGRIRHAFQFAGAARTARWSGRGAQPQNLPRTPGIMEVKNNDTSRLRAVISAIQDGKYADLSLLVEEPMIALTGAIRASFQAPKGFDLVVCDLSAIESAVLAWLSKCDRLLSVFREGRDPYRDFGAVLYGKHHSEVTSEERQICKPAVLGCGYQLGGGTIKKGKKTGLWGYAENMGVRLDQATAKEQVGLFRETYAEIPVFWRKLDDAAKAAILQRRRTVVNGLIAFEYRKPYMMVTLPSGRPMYYHLPKVVVREFEGEEIDPETNEPVKFTRRVPSYMGLNQATRQWVRLSTSGGKLTENVVQATAREILAEGMLRAARAGFYIVGHVHDELITLVRRGDNRLTLSYLRECMMADIDWAKGLPLGAAGYVDPIYRKG